ncbi:MAG: RNA methyltransferase [Bacteroidales bacterium]|nr:RNA methyltransferase [Bacteroidales bacterium]MCF8326700.1 RNA methyltransferase [Bacteroidales bacterium]
MKKLSLDELNRINIDQFKEAKKFPLVVILDNIRSMHNIGAVFRTGDAFRIEKLYLCGITATPPDKEITKTAIGATESVDWEYNKSTLEVVEKLKTEGYKTYALEQCENAEQLDTFQPDQDKIAVIFGNEVKGVQQDVVDACEGAIEIPQYGTKHSLNISVSAGILIWDLFLKQNEDW